IVPKSRGKRGTRRRDRSGLGPLVGRRIVSKRCLWKSAMPFRGIGRLSAVVTAEHVDKSVNDRRRRRCGYDRVWQIGDPLPTATGIVTIGVGHIATLRSTVF